MKWIRRITLVVALLGWTKVVWADEAAVTYPSFIEEEMRDVGFLVVGTAENYTDASRTAHRAARDLGVKLDLRGLVYVREHGLTLPPEAFKDDGSGDTYPLYWPRGHMDGGSYVSIEESAGYGRLLPGYFVVIAASGDPASVEMQHAFAKARRVYPDAYMFHEKVYQGCRH